MRITISGVLLPHAKSNLLPPLLRPPSPPSPLSPQGQAESLVGLNLLWIDSKADLPPLSRGRRRRCRYMARWIFDRLSFSSMSLAWPLSSPGPLCILQIVNRWRRRIQFYSGVPAVGPSQPRARTSAGLALLGSADMFDAKQVDQDIAVFYFYNVSLIPKQGEWRAVGLTWESICSYNLSHGFSGLKAIECVDLSFQLDPLHVF
jgi:hypothetical protein